MTRYDIVRNLFEYASMLASDYADIRKTLFGAVRKMEAEAGIAEENPLSESLKTVTWYDYFNNSNFSSQQAFQRIAEVTEGEPLPSILQYSELLKIIGSTGHDSFQQKADTAVSALGSGKIREWMIQHAHECDESVIVRDSDDSMLIGALCLSKPVDMSIIGKLCMEHPEIAPILSAIVNGED